MGLRRPRLIPRLDIKGPNVVKGIAFEGLRVVGKPDALARRYAEDADELLYIDTVASLYGRNQLTALLERTTDEVFIPITVAGGISSREDARRLFHAGADKVAINTAALRRPDLINELAGTLGTQGVVCSIEAKRTATGWEAYTDNGRERTGRCAVAWAAEAVARGAGEVLVTSIDRDGTRRGFDLELLRAIAALDLPVPWIACGGMGSIKDARQAYALGACVAMASVLHNGQLTIGAIRDGLNQGEFRPEGASEGRRSGARSEG